MTSVVFACVPALCQGWREAVWRCWWGWAGGADPSAAITRSSLCREQMPPAQKPKWSWLGPLLSLPNHLGTHLAELDVALGGHYRKCCFKRLWDYKILFTCPTEKSEHVQNICSSQGDKTQTWTALNHFEHFKAPAKREKVRKWSCLYCRMGNCSCLFSGWMDHKNIQFYRIYDTPPNIQLLYGLHCSDVSVQTHQKLFNVIM